MAGPRNKSGGDPAIHVLARDSTDLAERDARIKSGHDEKNWRVGEAARPTQNHANFKNRTLGKRVDDSGLVRRMLWPRRRRRAGAGVIVPRSIGVFRIRPMVLSETPTALQGARLTFL